MNYYISDLHLFCKNQTNEGVNHDGRPFDTISEMNRALLNNWNTRVTNGDTVYILGDIAMRGRNDELIALVAQLRGHKILVRGNHDSVDDYRYRQIFESIIDYAEITDYYDRKPYRLILSHYPILFWKDQHKGSVLLYGHTHNTIEHSFFQQCIDKINASEELSLRRIGGKILRAINVGACLPYVDYTPRTLGELLVGVGAEL